MNRKILVGILLVLIIIVVIAGISIWALYRDYKYPYGNYTDITVSGKVIDADTKQPIPDTQIRLDYYVKKGPDKGNPVDKSSLANSDGKFAFTLDLVGKEFTITISREGYQKYTEILRIEEWSGEKEIQKDFMLKKQ